jgi:hypothetical protein
MRNDTNTRALGASLLAILVLLLAPLGAMAQGKGDFKEKRFLVRYDSGTANLAPFTGLTLYVNPRHVKVLAGRGVLHEIPVGAVTEFTHELRAPFHPGKAMERTFNNTVGACSNIIDCPVLGAAGTVGAAGVGVATLFTPKENVITVRWKEDGQLRVLTMKIAWYQRDFILRALESATGMRASEQTYSAVPAKGAAPPNPPPGHGGPLKAAQPAQAAGLQSVAAQRAADAPAELVRRFEFVLDRPARVGGQELAPGFYLVLVEERSAGKVQIVFLDDTVRDLSATKIAARASAEIIEDASVAALEPIFREDGDSTTLIELRLPGRILKLAE